MNKFNDSDLYIRTVSIQAAPGCNLACEYCQMANQIHGEEKQKLWNDTMNSLEDGSYLNNIIKVLHKLNQPIINVNRLEIWGQEPTLALPVLSKNWKDWTQKLHGLQSVFFSTNGMNSGEIIFNFIKAIDDYAPHEMEFDMQLSYDGLYGEEKVRGGNSEIILNNIIELQKLINNHYFKNIKKPITIAMHAVLSTTLINYLDSIEKVDDYFKEYEEFYLKLKNVVNSTFIEIYPPCFMYQNCYAATSEEGLKLNNFISMANLIQQEGKYPNILNFEQDIAFQLLGNGAIDIYKIVERERYNSFDDFVNDCIENNEKLYSLPYSVCSTGLADLKIMYDGSIIMCQNSIFDTRIDKNLLNDSVDNWARYHFMTHGQTINPIYDSDEKIEKFYTYLRNLRKRSNFKFVYSTIFNEMYLLSKIGQINPEYYYDLDKLKRHAYIMTCICNCYYNMQVLTGSLFVRQTGEIRQICNGILDRLENIINSEIQKRKKVFIPDREKIIREEKLKKNER